MLIPKTIHQIWSSCNKPLPKALKLAFPKREDFRDASPCKSCKIFEEWYGLDNKDFPDPRCVNAPRQISVLIPQ